MRRNGHYVAMTGDGVNDVLSIKKANLGIAMQSGAQATRAAADIVLLKDSFAAVPAAFREGQRIRRGLQSVLNLFLVRVFTVSLIIIAVTFVRGGFPFSPSTMTLLTLLTVGIPTFALALFAHAGRAPDRILLPLFKFVLPATILMFLVAVFVYLIFYFLNDVDLETLRHASAAEVNNPDVSGALAKDALTYVMILCGLWLVVFTAPPNEWWAVIEETDRDWRPTAVAVLMIPLYVAILYYRWSRDLFSVELLTWWQYAIIAIAVTGWAFGLRYCWKNKIFDRFFGYG
jgi:cation-transporting ATPase E